MRPVLWIEDRSGADGGLIPLKLVSNPDGTMSVTISDLGGPTGQFGYRQYTLDTATQLIAPQGASQATIIVEGADARYTTDGTEPTAKLGMPMLVGSMFTFNGAEIANLQMIGQTAGSIANVTWEG